MSPIPDEPGLKDPAPCLLFDFGGTLDADGVAWKERFHGLYRAEGVVLSADAFARVFYDADDPLVGRLGPEADLGETVRRLTANIEAELAKHPFGADPARGERVAARYLAETEATVARNRPVLQALRRRYRLGVVSNFYGNLDAVCRGLDLTALFDVVVDSERAGVSKPEVAIFQAAMGPLGAQAHATTMIGDSLRRDGAGAKACGIDFIWLASPEDQAAEIAGPKAVARLDALTDLLL